MTWKLENNERIVNIKCGPKQESKYENSQTPIYSYFKKCCQKTSTMSRTNPAGIVPAEAFNEPWSTETLGQKGRAAGVGSDESLEEVGHSPGRTAAEALRNLIILLCTHSEQARHTQKGKQNIMK